MPNVRDLSPATWALHQLICIPGPFLLQTQSQEKIDLLRMLGAEVFPVPGEINVTCFKHDPLLILIPSILCLPAVAFENPDNYNHR